MKAKCGEIIFVDEFPYLPYLGLHVLGGWMEMRIPQASGAFGELCKAVFLDKNLRLDTDL